MQKLYFGDMLAPYVAADDTSSKHVDVFCFWRHDPVRLWAAATGDRPREPGWDVPVAARIARYTRRSGSTGDQPAGIANTSSRRQVIELAATDQRFADSTALTTTQSAPSTLASTKTRTWTPSTSPSSATVRDSGLIAEAMVIGTDGADSAERALGSSD